MTAPPGNVAAIRARLRERFDKALTQLYIANVQQQLHHGFMTEWRDHHADVDATFPNYYSRMYAQSQALTIRRLSDKDDVTASLYVVVDRIQRDPAIASRELMLDEVRKRQPGDPEIVSSADLSFTLRYGDVAHPTYEQLDELKSRITTSSDRCRIFADGVVAHTNAAGLPDGFSLTYEEIHAALQSLSQVASDLKWLFEWVDLRTEVMLTGDWKEGFRDGMFVHPTSDRY